jgi:hypothetical protein
MNKKILSFLTITALLFGNFWNLVSNITNAEWSSYTNLRDVDKGSFNEYRYKITKNFFKLKETFEVDFVINSTVANNMLLDAAEAFKYLPDDLNNDLKYNKLKIALKKAIKYPNNEVYFSGITKALKGFIEEPLIESIVGTINATPNQGNAPLVTTLTASIEDPTWTEISKSAYIWWVNINWKRQIIWNRSTLSRTFIAEWNYTVFLDVKSSHKNSKGYRDVLPFTSSVKIKVKEKIASVILRISWKALNSEDEVKFSPETASYGLLFDASSSVPTNGTKFLKTSWDFGNGVRKSYKGSPKVERVIYSREWNYEAYLELKTNTWKTIRQKIKVLIQRPIASIKVNKTEGFMWDKFSFRAESHWTNNLTYSWEIINTDRDKTVIKKIWDVFNYSFKDKGKYSVKLRLKDLAWNVGIDTKTIFINSRAPVADFKAEIPFANKPNQVFLDATSSYDLDYNDDGNLKYIWTIDWQKVNLEWSNDNWSTGFYTFSTIWDHSILLEVEDLDNMVTIKRSSVKINSILALDFSIYPRVAQRNTSVRFISDSPEAKFYTWNFWDDFVKSESDSKITHKFLKSWIFPVKLTVMWENNKKNTYIKNVYIWDSNNPVSVIDISRSTGFDFVKENNACWLQTAYIVNRKDNIIFSGKDSIDTDGKNTWLSYSWKIGQWKYKKWNIINHRFDELGCYNIKLTVKSDRDNTTDVNDILVKVKNIKPTISSLQISPFDLTTDPVVVNVSAVGSKDKDWVIQSYIWYYTTDIDSEAQDFRITKKASTTFVIPKIQWTYYFGVVMKDNNGAKINSEDLVNKIWNNFVELQWDNSNTPLIDFSTSDSSISIWDEMSFRAIAKNIRWDSIEKESQFFWDFDWDGFYEKETNWGIISYNYKKSGTFYPKVKVRNKGFSNTRTLTVNVSNKLVADFSSISIWNKYIFVDKSKWTIDKNIWNLWDWNKQEDKDKFIYSYEDKKQVHSVELLVSEGTKTKKITKEIERDLKNIIKSRKKWLNLFSFPAINSSWSIILEEEEDIFMYLWESKWDFKYFGVDYDISDDSDINWGKDDDIDNFNNTSYKDWSPEKIILNNNKEQIIRLFLVDENNKTIESKDVKIVKNYIEDIKEIKSWDIKFTWISNSVKTKIENLKVMITKLPQKDRMNGMRYLQKMQENWLDETEKVRTIIEFEEFLESTWNKDVWEIIDLLESLLVEWEEDKSEKNIAFTALKSLIPDDIQCKTDIGTCKEFLVKKLEQIKNSSDVVNNKEIWKEFWVPIWWNKNLTVKQKNDFKAILKILINSWLDNVPESEVEDVKKVDEYITVYLKWKTYEEDEKSGKLMTFLKKAGWWVSGIVWVIILLMFVFWILDFLKNRKSWESFEDFVDNKSNDEDILWDLSYPLEEKEETKVDSLFEPEKKKSAVFSAESQIPEIKEEPIIDETKKEEEFWFSLNNNDTKEEIKEEEIKEEKIKEEKITEDYVKDNWLSNFDLEEKTKIEGENTPDWLKKSLTNKLPEKEEMKKEDFIEEEKEVETESTIIMVDKEEKKIDLENDIPEWLKSSDSDDEETEEINLGEEKVEEFYIPKDKLNLEEPKNEELNSKKEELNFGEETSSEDNVPDWLKGSLEKNKEEIKKDKNEKEDEIINKEVEEKQSINTNNTLDDEDVPSWLKDSLKKENKVKKEPKKANKKENVDVNKKDDNKENKKDDLWDDGMTIPDWLKND